jgi:hypothetical protein
MKKAREFFKKAADQRNLDGLVWYWICDWENGINYFKEAAEQ